MSSGVVAKLADALLGLAQAAIVVERATASSTAFLTKIKVLIIYATHCDFCEREFRTTLIRVFWNALESPFGMKTFLERYHSKRAFEGPQFLV